ncbi:MAG: hypothetical protein HYX34_02465 [Actinobacteria bacterium]|nr:hypothetical protein [Actinomycetota bacterium]
MSPVQRTTGHAGRALAVALVAVLVAGVGLWLASLAISRRSTTDIGLGDQTFQGGSVVRLAAEIADRGPIIYPDVSGERSRDIILQHLGSDPERGWYAFLAQPGGKPRACTWQWLDARRGFRAKCDRSLTLPPDGRGAAERFPVKVRKGRLDIDLNYRTRPTAPSTTTTTAPVSGGKPGG